MAENPADIHFCYILAAQCRAGSVTLFDDFTYGAK